MKPLDRAVYWIEYVIRNGGAKHLIGDSVELNDSQYFLIDVMLVLLILFGSTVWFCRKCAIKATSKFKAN